MILSRHRSTVNDRNVHLIIGVQDISIRDLTKWTFEIFRPGHTLTSLFIKYQLSPMFTRVFHCPCGITILSNAAFLRNNHSNVRLINFSVKRIAESNVENVLNNVLGHFGRNQNRIYIFSSQGLVTAKII